MTHGNRPRRVAARVACWSLAAAMSAPVAATTSRPPKPPREVCALLDDAEKRPLMDAVLNHLLRACGREHELGGVVQATGPAPADADAASGGIDVPVNDPSGDSGVSQTQSETSIAVNRATGTVCVGYNDAFHRVQGEGVTGFSRSTDGGLTFTDRGALDPDSDGDPSLVWRQADGAFYFATLANGGVGLWRSTDDCRSFDPAGMVHDGPSDDKEMMAVDNYPSSPFYGNIYVAWTDFGTGGEIRLSASSDGGESWSDPVRVSSLNTSVQGAWPAAAPDGDLYVAWTRFASGLFSIEGARSADGGRTFTPLAPPAVDRVKPEDAEASATCARSALNGHIRHSPFPQLTVGPDSAVHVVYAADPNGPGVDDSADVFYRRSSDHGGSWESEIRLNDDQTSSDQFFPTLSVGTSNVVTISWYDRRHDPANLFLDHYQITSQDGGSTWGANQRVSDVSSPVSLDPAMATCYHGDYDTHLQSGGQAMVLWSDDRNVHGGVNDPDVFMDPSPLSDDFLLVPDIWRQPVCAHFPASFTIHVQQFVGFDQPVTLSTPDLAPGLVAAFSVNPVVPPGMTHLDLTGTGAVAAGSYPISVEGVSEPGAITHHANLALDVFTALPATAAHHEPADGAEDVDVRPTLVWTEVEQAPFYIVQVATDVGFNDVVYAADVETNSHAVTRPLMPETPYYWRVRGDNVCGYGSWSEPTTFTTRSVPPTLLVDDDDDLPDVRPFYEDALSGIDRAFDVWDTTNSNEEPTVEDLELYEVVIWFSGGEYGGGAGPGSAGEAALSQWLDEGNACLLLSGQDIHWDHGLTPFMEDYLGIAEVEDDTGQEVVTGQGSFFEGLGPFDLAYPFNNYSDTVIPRPVAEVAFEGDQGPAGIAHSFDGYRTTFFGFPFEAIPTAAHRQAVMAAFLERCSDRFSDGFESGDTSAWSLTVP